MVKHTNWEKNLLTPVVTPKDHKKRYRSCSIKKPYESEIEAELKAQSLGIMNYRCKWCGNWHIGHRKARRNG